MSHAQSRPGALSTVRLAGGANRNAAVAVPALHGALETVVAGGGSGDPSLACFGARLRAGMPLRIVAFGTSITAGHASPSNERAESYGLNLQRLLRKAYPQSNVTVAIYGYPGASAAFMRACIDRMVPVAADLYLVEIADNYMPRTTVAYRSVGEYVEGMLQNLLQRPARGLGGSVGPAAILVAPFPQSCSKALASGERALPAGTADTANINRALHAARANCASNLTLPGVLEALGRDHNLPVSSVRLALAKAIARHPRPSSLLRRFLMKDLIHTNSEGSGMLARLVLHALISRTKGATLAACDAPRQPRRAFPSIPLQRRSNRSRTPSPGICAFGEELHRWVLSSSGFAYVVERSPLGQPKPGLVARRPLATLELCYRGGDAASHALPRYGSQLWWQFGFLRSYVGMGIARGECVSGCTCSPREWDAHHSKNVSQTDVSKLFVHHFHEGSARRGGGGGSGSGSGGCPCVIRLSVLNRTSSGGHKFKVVALFNGFRMYNPSFALCPREGGDRWGRGKCSSHELEAAEL